MIRISAFSVFLISGFDVSGLRVNLHLTLQSRLNRRFIRGFRAETCLADFLILEQTFTSGRLFYRATVFSSKRDTVSPVLSFGLVTWDSKIAAYQQFLKHIYWNFMDFCISGIGIWLNFWVSASDELGKSHFWQNLLEIDPLRFCKLQIKGDAFNGEGEGEGGAKPDGFAILRNQNQTLLSIWIIYRFSQG